VKYNFYPGPRARVFGLFPRALLNSSSKLKNLTRPSIALSPLSDSHSPKPYRPFSLSASISDSPSIPFSLSASISDSLSIPFSLSPLSQTQSLSIPSLSQLRSPEAKILTVSPSTILAPPVGLLINHHVCTSIYLFIFHARG
jgi:hypothetical protein